MKQALKWNRRYKTMQLPEPSQVLATFTHLLPPSGTALDLACGLGANALLLARHGLETYAWDYAETALKSLRTSAQSEHLQIQIELRDIVISPPPANMFDVIVVCHFLDRSLVPALMQALKPNGLLFYQTFTRNATFGPKNDEFRLAQNELLHLFNKLQIIVYREEGNIGDIRQGFRNEALLIGKKMVKK